MQKIAPIMIWPFALSIFLASTASAAPQTDLYVKSLTVVASAAQVTYTVEICNSGGSASNFELGLYEDRATQPGCAHQPDQELPIASLAMNACTSKAFVSSSPLPIGSYLAWAFVDSGCTVSEGTAGEENNFLSEQYTVGAAPDGGADASLADASIEDGSKPPDLAAQDAPSPDTTPLYDSVSTSDAGGDPSTPPGGDDDGGCSCELGGSPSALSLVALALLLLARRRRAVPDR